jgi:hypothetical protein
MAVSVGFADQHGLPGWEIPALPPQPGRGRIGKECNPQVHRTAESRSPQSSTLVGICRWGYVLSKSCLLLWTFPKATLMGLMLKVGQIERFF